MDSQFFSGGISEESCQHGNTASPGAVQEAQHACLNNWSAFLCYSSSTLLKLGPGRKIFPLAVLGTRPVLASPSSFVSAQLLASCLPAAQYVWRPSLHVYCLDDWILCLLGCHLPRNQGEGGADSFQLVYLLWCLNRGLSKRLL